MPATILDRNLHFVAVNELLADINGLSVADHLGRHAMEVLPRLQDDVYAAFGSVIETGIAIGGLLVVGETQAQPGVERAWREHVAPLLDAGGSVTGIVVTVEEITEQRRLTDQLEALVEAHAALARVGEMLVRASSREEAVMAIVAGSMVATGADRAAIFERTGDALRLVEASGFPDVLVRELREGVPEHSLVHLVARSGEPFLLSTLDELKDRFPSFVPIAEAAGDRALAAVPLATESGVLGVLRLGYDAPHPFLPGERDRLLLLGSLAAQALARSESFDREIRSRRLLEEVVRQMPVGVSITDSTGAVIARNPAVVAAWHGEPESTSIEDYSRFRGVRPDGRPYGAHDWPIARSLERGEVVVGELIDIERLDGTRAVISLSSAPVRDAAGTTIAGVAVVVDVTAERQAELAREAFIGTLSHELGTPVTSIVAGAAVLARRSSLDPEVAQSVAADVAAEATRLMRLVEDVLVLSRVERGVALERSAPVLVHQVARRVLAEEANLWPALAIELDVGPGLPMASGDEAYVAQVLRNLLSNAAKYGDGRATVRVGRVDGGVELEVTDGGPGIAGEDRERVFELFYRLDRGRSAPGAGIGLFICRRLVEAMGGTLALRDGAGGACFRMWLPMYAGQDASEHDDP